MQITSSAFDMDDPIPQEYTCDGDNINPPLSISEIPNGTKSFCLIMDDPDAPAGPFVHWLVWNIDPEITEIDEDDVPDGASQGVNDAGKLGYMGPCPPSGVHHYQFTVYALDSMIDVRPRATALELVEAMEGHVLDKTVLVGTYEHEE
jgi:Raf kinase inhibitor-like YbhB/YbcL family protein